MCRIAVGLCVRSVGRFLSLADVFVPPGYALSDTDFSLFHLLGSKVDL